MTHIRDLLGSIMQRLWPAPPPAAGPDEQVSFMTRAPLGLLQPGWRVLGCTALQDAFGPILPCQPRTIAGVRQVMHGRFWLVEWQEGGMTLWEQGRWCLVDTGM